MTIPEQVTITLPTLQRSALQTLMDAAPPGYQLGELLELVLIKGIATLMKRRELPVSDSLAERAQASFPSGKSRVVKTPRVAADYVGFSIEAHQQVALDELEERFPLLDEDEVLRILLDAALRALPHDVVAQRRLNALVFVDQLLEGDAS